MKTLLAFTLASAYGLLIRFLFAFYGSILAVFSISLVFLAPLTIGYLTVSLAGPKNVDNNWAAFFRPWATTLVLLVITILISVEGAICWIIIYPIFSFMAGIGGLIAFGMMKDKERRVKNTDQSNVLDDFDRNDSLKSSLLMLMPLLIGAVEQDRLLSPDTYQVVRSVEISAAPAAVWASLTELQDIKTVEHHSFFTNLFGLPKHLRTELDTLAIGAKRTAYYERGLYFEETVKDFKAPEWLTVSIKADPGNIPPTVLDEHVVIGGKHFKALEDTYLLTSLPDGRCRLELSGKIEINTPFNWYSSLWARWMLADSFDSLLGIIQARAMRQGQ